MLECEKTLREGLCKHIVLKMEMVVVGSYWGRHDSSYLFQWDDNHVTLMMVP